MFVLLPTKMSAKSAVNEKTQSAFSVAFSGAFLRFAEDGNTRKPDRFDKTRFGPFWGGKYASPKVEIGTLSCRSHF